ncbi:MAG TPA: UDP-glucose 4-epimerase GalE [Candidatus Babeliales bacterium]|nr:UDP-glucose 4-epimerase GalE [Candidatus Babeliales bacterium]
MELDIHKPTVLVTGGAGYIGSNTARLLASKGYQVVILDSMRYGQHFYPSWARIIKADFADQSVLDQLFTHYNVQAVMHFAGLIEVGRSVKDPSVFYQENVTKVFSLLNKMREYQIDKFIFSSSAAVYGKPKTFPITEESPCNPVNAYGNTKYNVEKILQDYSTAYGLRFVALRYFNAAGADTENMLGERHEPETHIIPLLLQAAHNGATFNLFGDDYDTPDGSCIRDYLHVKDLATAHYKALGYLNTHKTGIFNLGTGMGVSNKELVAMVKKVTGLSFEVLIKDRREGDPDRLVADASKANRELGWIPEHSYIETIITDAWGFYQKKDTRMHCDSDQHYQQRMTL